MTSDSNDILVITAFVEVIVSYLLIIRASAKVGRSFGDAQHGQHDNDSELPRLHQNQTTYKHEEKLSIQKMFTTIL